MSRLAIVAVPVPQLEPLTYRLADDQRVVVGSRVLVPLGSRLVTGCVVALADEREWTEQHSRHGDGKGVTLKPVREVLDTEAFLPDEVLQLARWVADYYLCSLGEAIATAAPPFAWAASRPHVEITEEGRRQAAAGAGEGIESVMLRTIETEGPVHRPALGPRVARALARLEGERAATIDVSPAAIGRSLLKLVRLGWVRVTRDVPPARTAERTVGVAELTAAGLDTGVDAALAARQREALVLIRGAGGRLAAVDLRSAGVSMDTLARLARKGLVAIRRERVERDPFASGQHEALGARREPVELTDEQQAALDALAAPLSRGQFHVTLLHGITGSGKTEIYKRLAAKVQAVGRRVLILVPEIALTPALAGTFREAFDERVAIQHSGLSGGERHDQWHRIRRGEIDVVVGTRSAVFAPLSSIGLIVVDEEHDTSYKQDDAPRYNGRDVAIVRARAARALVVLGSATPSLESYQNAVTGRYQLVELTRRVFDRRLAQVSVVNMREEYAEAGPDAVLSRSLQSALGDCIGRGEQAMVLLNRRGYAPTVFCRQCGGRLECPNCSVSLTVHKAVHRARCHYCDYSVQVPEACQSCGGTYLEYTGVGTERVEAELRELLAGVRVARVDRDTIRRRGEISRVLARFARREIDVLVGTQMIAKGHDFPAVTLVGVISADVGLGLADFRAAERTFQLLTQVAGRAGRGVQAGTAIVQTLYPEHYSIRHACTQDYRAFFDEEIQYRRAMRYPPSFALVNLTVRGSTALEALSAATDLAGLLRTRSQHYLVLGPAPAPLQRLRGEHRVQIFLKGTTRKPMRLAVREALARRPDLVRRTTIDVDPISVL